MTQDRPKHNHHREFWEAGLHVFPLNNFSKVKDGNLVCGCGKEGCTAFGKHPRAKNWQHTPLWDDEQFENIEECGFWTPGFGVLCNRTDNGNSLLVVDVDVRNGGADGYTKLIADIPEVAHAGMIVASGRGDGGRHLYFTLPEPLPLVMKLDQYPGLDFKSSGFVVGPGSRHETGGIYQLVHGGPEEIEPAPQALIDLLRKPERHRAEVNGRFMDVSHAEIADMLAHVDPDCDYDTWIRIGMAIHHATGGTGQAVWDAWSANGSKYESDAMDGHWHSFGRSANPVTLGTLVHHAEQGGWIEPVTFGDAGALPFVDGDEEDAPALDQYTGFDPAKPPGMMGEIAAWIESQSRRRRAIAATGTAIWVSSCLFAEYTDDMDSVNPNTISFIVAGSGSGKEAIQKAGARLVRIAGYAPAVHGTIKSEREIVENLIRHQVAHYQIDEVGELLTKIRNAQKRGGAAHHEGTIGMLMSAYSKADNFLLIGGDRKEEAKATLAKEKARLEKQIEENENKDFAIARMASVKKMLESIENGIERPYLTLIGYTVPQTFDTLMDFETATNGFMRRAIIYQEYDTAPRTKAGFRPAPLPPQMENTIRMIGTNGRFDVLGGGRIELSDTRRIIPTSVEARRLLLEAQSWFDDAAVAHKSRSGLEALFLGAYEQVSKVSLLLGCWGGLREVEHVRWAFELVKRDVEAKALAVTANDRVKDSPKLALEARILSIVSDPDGVTMGIIANRCRKFRKEDVEAMLGKMQEAGKVRSEDVKAGFGKVSKRFFKT